MSNPLITRRQMLALTAALAAAGAVGTGLQLASWWEVPADSPHRWLAHEEAAFLVALAGALFPAGGVPALAGDDARVDRFVDALFDGLPELQRKALKLLIQALDARPVITELRHFQELPATRREALVWEWLQSPLAEARSAVQSVVLLVSMAYTTHPEAAVVISPWTGCGWGT